MNLLRTVMITFLFSIATISNAGFFEINDAQVKTIVSGILPMQPGSY